MISRDLGEGKSPVYSDEKLATQKQSSSNDRSRTVPDDNGMYL